MNDGATQTSRIPIAETLYCICHEIGDYKHLLIHCSINACEMEDLIFMQNFIRTDDLWRLEDEEKMFVS